MSKRSKITIAVLCAIVIALGILLFRAEKKMHDFADHVDFTSKIFLWDSLAVDMQIQALTQVKTDTGELKEIKYQMAKEDFQRANLYQMFVLATMVNDAGDNRDTLNALADEFNLAMDPVKTFFILNDSTSDFTNAEVDKLIADYQKLAAVTMKFKRMQLNLW